MSALDHFHFLRCFGHAPLLAQIGLFGGLGFVTSALIIIGIGGCLGLIGIKRRWGAIFVLAGVALCIGFHILNESEYGRIKYDDCKLSGKFRNNPTPARRLQRPPPRQDIVAAPADS